MNKNNRYLRLSIIVFTCLIFIKPNAYSLLTHFTLTKAFTLILILTSWQILLTRSRQNILTWLEIFILLVLNYFSLCVDIKLLLSSSVAYTATSKYQKCSDRCCNVYQSLFVVSWFFVRDNVRLLLFTYLVSWIYWSNTYL